MVYQPKPQLLETGHSVQDKFIQMRVSLKCTELCTVEEMSAVIVHTITHDVQRRFRWCMDDVACIVEAFQLTPGCIPEFRSVGTDYPGQALCLLGQLPVLQEAAPDPTIGL